MSSAARVSERLNTDSETILSFLHSRFAIVIIPTYEDPADAPSQAVLDQRRDWKWLNTVNRVCSGVKKVSNP